MTWTVVESDGQGGYQIATIDGEPRFRLTRNKINNKYIVPPWYDAGLQPSDVTNPPSYLVGKYILQDVTIYPPLNNSQQYGSLGAPVFDIPNRTATWTYTIDTIPLADRKSAMKTAASAKFRIQRDAGKIVNLGGSNIPVSTTHAAVVELNESLVQMGQNGTMDVVTRSGTPVVLTPTIANSMLTAIRNYVEACQLREYTLYTAIDAAATHADLDAIDINSGWPT